MIKFENVTYTYSAQSMPAVKNINFEVPNGKIILCTGASGCGKSTIMRLANGLCPHHFQGKLEGSVFVGGHNTIDVTINDLSSIIGTLFQDPEQQFFALGVEDEIAFAHECRNVSPESIKEKIDKVLKSFSIEHIRNSSIHELSEGQKQKVGLASLCTQDIRSLILDEPTANLDPESTAELAKKLVELKEKGMAILVVDHRLYWLEGIADEVLVMSKGEIMERGDYSILYNNNLRKKYGLRATDVTDKRNVLPQADSTKDNICLNIKNLHFAYKDKEKIYNNSGAILAQGVTALIGDNGTGKTTLARILTGLTKTQEGEFLLAGKKVEQENLLKYVGIVLQNADYQLNMRSVFEEVQMCFLLAEKLKGTIKNISSKTNKELFSNEVLELTQLLGLEHLLTRHPQSLSGGEKQRLVIACALAKQPNLLILDEPTSGLDGGNMYRIKNALDIAKAKGTNIIVITHDLELIDIACEYALKLPL